MKRAYLTLINIDFDEENAAVLLSHSLEFGGQHFAWSAPGGEEIADDQLVTLDGFTEVLKGKGC